MFISQGSRRSNEMGNFFDDEKRGIETDNREKLFEDVKHTDEDGEEYWLARELQEVLQYKEWRNFVKVIDKAKAACRNTGNVENDYFVGINKIVTTGIAT